MKTLMYNGIKYFSAFCTQYPLAFLFQLQVL